MCNCFCRMLSCVCVLLLAASALAHLDEVTLDAQWEQWKGTHSKEYNGLVSVCLLLLHLKVSITKAQSVVLCKEGVEKV